MNKHETLLDLDQQTEQDVDDSFTDIIQETEKTVSFPVDLGDLNTGLKQPVLQVNISLKIQYCNLYITYIL